METAAVCVKGQTKEQRLICWYVRPVAGRDIVWCWGQIKGIDNRSQTAMVTFYFSLPVQQQQQSWSIRVGEGANGPERGAGLQLHRCNINELLR